MGGLARIAYEDDLLRSFDRELIRKRVWTKLISLQLLAEDWGLQGNSWCRLASHGFSSWLDQQQATQNLMKSRSSQLARSHF